jgi:hypothetical protein
MMTIVGATLIPGAALDIQSDSRMSARDDREFFRSVWGKFRIALDAAA